MNLQEYKKEVIYDAKKVMPLLMKHYNYSSWEDLFDDLCFDNQITGYSTLSYTNNPKQATQNLRNLDLDKNLLYNWLKRNNFKDNEINAELYDVATRAYVLEILCETELEKYYYKLKNKERSVA